MDPDADANQYHYECCICQESCGIQGRPYAVHQCHLVFCAVCYKTIGGSKRVIELSNNIEPGVSAYREQLMRQEVAFLCWEANNGP